MNVLDWIFTAVVVVLALRCFVRGFIHEILSAAAVVVGIMAGLLFANTVNRYLLQKIGLNALPYQAQYAIAFVLCFLVGFLIMKLIERMLREGLEAGNLDFIDRLLGLAAGVLEGFVVAALFIVILKLQPLLDVKDLLEGSIYVRLLAPIIEPAMYGTLDQMLQKGIPSIIPSGRGK